MYTYETTVSMRDGDAAGVLFFARHFSLAHDAYERFMQSRGVPLGDLIRDGKVRIPIVHAESDNAAPLKVGDSVTIVLAPEEVGQRKFTLRYELRNVHGEVACTIRTVHVTIDAQTGQAIPLPEAIVEALSGNPRAFK